MSFSSSAVTMRRLVRNTDLTSAECCSSRTGVPVSRSHTMAVLSLLPDTARLPPRWSATARTLLRCLARENSAARVSLLQTASWPLSCPATSRAWSSARAVTGPPATTLHSSTRGARTSETPATVSVAATSPSLRTLQSRLAENTCCLTSPPRVSRGVSSTTPDTGAEWGQTVARWRPDPRHHSCRLPSLWPAMTSLVSMSRQLTLPLSLGPARVRVLSSPALLHTATRPSSSPAATLTSSATMAAAGWPSSSLLVAGIPLRQPAASRPPCGHTSAAMKDLQARQTSSAQWRLGPSSSRRMARRMGAYWPSANSRGTTPASPGPRRCMASLPTLSSTLCPLSTIS